MPRGTSRPAETVIGELEAKKTGYQTKIESYKTKIGEIDNKIRNLNDHRRQKDIERVMDAIRTSGRSIDDFVTSFLESAKLNAPGS
jgi:peptidoglycan hydrolase CwlO-like protein